MTESDRPDSGAVVESAPVRSGKNLSSAGIVRPRAHRVRGYRAVSSVHTQALQNYFTHAIEQEGITQPVKIDTLKPNETLAALRKYYKDEPGMLPPPSSEVGASR